MRDKGAMAQGVLFTKPCLNRPRGWHIHTMLCAGQINTGKCSWALLKNGT
jgi:hypothetical protein